MITGDRKILAQVRGQSAIATAYSPANGVRAVIDTIIVANTSGTSVDYQICVDDDGTTYTAATAIAWNVPAGDGTVTVYEVKIPFNGNGTGASNGNIAIMSATNDAHTFTILGEEFTV